MQFILKVQNRISSIKFDMLFTWLRQRVVKGLDVAPWWFIYLGCNACLVCFDFKIQKFILDSFFTNQMFIICNGFVSVKYGFYHLKCDLVLGLLMCVQN